MTLAHLQRQKLLNLINDQDLKHPVSMLEKETVIFSGHLIWVKTAIIDLYLEVTGKEKLSCQRYFFKKTISTLYSHVLIPVPTLPAPLVAGISSLFLYDCETCDILLNSSPTRDPSRTLQWKHGVPVSETQGYSQITLVFTQNCSSVQGCHLEWHITFNFRVALGTSRLCQFLSSRLFIFLSVVSFWNGNFQFLLLL